MSMKNTLILGLAGAAAIYTVRKIPALNTVTTNTPFNDNGKTVPLIPPGLMARNSWSFAFVAIPAIGAWYLSR